MQGTVNPYVRVVVDFLHDVAAGLFPGTVLGAWLIGRGAESAGVGGGVVDLASRGLWLVMLLGLTVSVATGLIRLRYWKLNVRAGFLESKAQMAVIKHSAFVLLVVGSGFALYAVT